MLALLLLQTSSADDAATGGLACCGTVFFVIAAVIVLNGTLLVWVARDAKARGMDGAAIWMLLEQSAGRGEGLHALRQLAGSFLNTFKKAVDILTFPTDIREEQ